MSNNKSNSSLASHLDELQNVATMQYDMDIFKGLAPAELVSYLDKAEARTYSAGSILFTPEDFSRERLYILSRGRVDLYRLTASGKKLVTRQILPGSVFGIRALLSRVVQKNYAEAVEDSTVCIITKEQFWGLLERRPELMLRIIEIVCKRLYLLEERLLETAYNPASARLSYFLLTNADTATGTLVNVTHEEIANTIGTVRQTVTQTLSRMSKQGLISTEPKQIHIIDRRGLEKVIKSFKD